MEAALSASVQTLPGIGKVSGKALEARGFASVGDLLFLLPKRYDDQRQVTPIAGLQPGERALVAGVVRSASQPPRRGRRRMSEVRLVPRADDAPGRYGQLRLVWFHGLPGLAARFPVGAEVTVYGRVDEHRGVLSIAHPEIHTESAGIVPRYPDIQGVSAAALRKALGAAVQRAGSFVPDAIPPELLKQAQLAPIAEALVALHAPPADLPSEALAQWNEAETSHHQRLAFEELFLLELALHRRRAEEAGVPARACAIEDAVASQHAAALPFTLTAAQTRALAEVRHDLGREVPMRRLLQGDVGSGKTAVALLAAAQVARTGAQVALLAPTEVLAEQHLQSIAQEAAALGLRPLLLAGKLRAQERRERLREVASGGANFIIGTHALMGAGVDFHDLAAAIVDEQHRFGVAQRLGLVEKGGGRAPHLLVMTATPIPRSLALALYGDLDVSVLDALPPGRRPVITRRYAQPARNEAYRQLERALAAGGRAFVVCPAIGPGSATDESEASSSLRGVEETYAELVKAHGEGAVAMLHAKLDTETRRDAMQRFAAGDAQILVATTIVEVGVDVPEANLIVIEDAERFGLAQLHQLRGRVGRGERQSACLLVHGETLTEDAELRLSAMCESTDGFFLAERDLDIRGPGQLFGVRQAGGTGFRFANLRRDLALLPAARDLARSLLELDPALVQPQHQRTLRAIERVLERDVIAEDAG